ncbi:MAG: isoamylase early set domain-containing protein [bacterium]
MRDPRVHDDELPEPLDRAVSLIRDEPPLRAEWRAAVLAGLPTHEIAPPPTPRRQWSLSPFAAIAAGIVCALAGAGATLIAVNAHVLATVAPLVTPTAMASASLHGPSSVRFALVAPTAVHVSIVGDFNRWNPAALPLKRSADGRTWEIEVPLLPGRYTYAFVVDGRLARDPVAPEAASDDFGIANSVVLVKGS